MKTEKNNPAARQKKSAETLAQTSLGLLPLIINNIPQAVFWKDRNLVYLGCNQAFADDAGFPSPEAVIGKTDFDMPWKEQAELYRADDRRIMEQGEAKLNYEEPQSTPDGSIIWLNTSKIPITENGEIVAVLGMYEDITSRKQAEKAVQESEERFRRFTEATAEGLVFHEQGKIIDVNPAALAMYGNYDHTELVGKNLLQFIAPESHSTVLQQIQLDIVHPYEIQCIRKDGSIFPAETSTRIYQMGGKVIRASTVRDITSRKQAEGALQSHKEFSQKQATVFAELARSESLYSGNLKDALAEITKTAADTLQIKRSSIWFYNEDRSEIRCMNLFEQDKGHTGGIVLKETDFPAYFKALEEERVISAHNAHIDPATFEFSGPYLTPLGINSMLDAPIRQRGQVIGVICNEHVGPVREWTLEEQNFARAIVDFVTIALETQERKQTELLLRENEQRFRGMAETMPDGLTVLEGNQVVFMNERLPQILGYSKEELSHLSSFDYAAPEETDRLKQLAQKAKELGQPLEQLAFWAVRKDGERRFIRNRYATLRDNEQKIYGRVITTTDETERILLEQQIRLAFEKRGYQVQVSTEISQEIATAPELGDLFERVVTLTKERLNYYQTQLLRYDPAQDAVVLISGYGETGKKMLADGHKMPMGAGLIGSAAASGKTILRSNLEEDPDWQPNPLLPGTRGEIAVPIKFGEQILGVLDVQSDSAGALTEDDRLLLEGLCGQIGVAIEQTRLRQEMTERLNEINRLYQTLSREGWRAYRDSADLPEGFIYDQAGVRPVEDDVLPEDIFANIPMKVLGGDIVGTLSIASDPQHPASPEELDFLQQVSEQVALALESARLFEQTQSALAQTERLAEASLRFARAANLQELLAVVCETLEIPAVNRGVLTTYHYSITNELESMNVVANWKNNSLHEPAPVGKRYPASQVQALSFFLLNSTPTVFNDLATDERASAPVIDFFGKQNTLSAAVLPLALGARPIGVLFLETEAMHAFTSEEIRLFSAMAPQIATVLENRIQFERAQRQAEREAMLNAISQKIQGATSVEAVLQIAARELGHALGAPRTIAQLSIKDSKS